MQHQGEALDVELPGPPGGGVEALQDLRRGAFEDVAQAPRQPPDDEDADGGVQEPEQTRHLDLVHGLGVQLKIGRRFANQDRFETFATYLPIGIGKPLQGFIIQLESRSPKGMPLRHRPNPIGRTAPAPKWAMPRRSSSSAASIRIPSPSTRSSNTACRGTTVATS